MYINNDTLLLLHGEDFSDSSYYRNGVKSNNCALADGGKFGKCFDLNRSMAADYYIKDSSSLGITIDFWTFLRSSGSYPTFFGTRPKSGTRGVYGHVTSGKLALSVTNYSTLVVNSTFPLNTWTHVAYTIDVNKQACIYINGEKVATGTLNDTVDFTSVTIGALLHQGSIDSATYIDGKLDEFRISKGVLYNGNFSVPTQPYKGVTINVSECNLDRIRFSAEGNIEKIQVRINGKTKQEYTQNYRDLVYIVDKSSLLYGENKVEIAAINLGGETTVYRVINNQAVPLPESSGISDIINRFNSYDDMLALEIDMFKEVLKEKGLDVDEVNRLAPLIDKTRELKGGPILDKRVFSILVNENNANPDTMITYTDASVGIEPATRTGYGGWADIYPFNSIKPCSFQGGNVYKYIDPNNFKLHEDGTSVDHSVDVMIEIPKFYWKIKKNDNGYKISISQTKLDDTWSCPAHTVGSTEKDNIYIGAWTSQATRGYTSKYTSSTTTYDRGLSSPSIVRGRTTQTDNQSHGYTCMTYFSYTMFQILFAFMFKTFDSRKALGLGMSASSYICQTYNKGMMYGTVDNSNEHIKFLGVEALWWSIPEVLEGIYKSGNYMKVSNNLHGSNDPSTSPLYRNLITIPATNSGYMSKAIADSNESAFLPSELKGSMTTYYCSSHNLTLNTCVTKQSTLYGTYSTDSNSASYSGRACYYGTDNGLPHN